MPIINYSIAHRLKRAQQMILMREEKMFRLDRVIQALDELMFKWPLKHLKLTCSQDGLCIDTFVDSFGIYAGSRVSAQFFSNYICETRVELLVPLRKLGCIVALRDRQDDSMTISHKAGQPDLEFRFHSTKTGQKTVVTVNHSQNASEMVSQKNQQPIGSLLYLRHLQQNQQAMGTGIETHEFQLPCLELLRVSKQFAEVSQMVSLRFQPEPGGRRKHIVMSAETPKGLKTVLLSEEMGEREILFYSSREVEDLQKPYACYFSSALLRRLSQVYRSDLMAESVRMVLDGTGSMCLLYPLTRGDGHIYCMMKSASPDLALNLQRYLIEQ